MDKEKSALINELKSFKSQNNRDRMHLFGSRAYGASHQWSDVDLIVV